MTKKYKCGKLVMGLIIVLLIALLNIHIETYQIEKTKTIKINGEKDVFVGRNFNDIYCDTSFKACYRHFNCPNDVDITYEWKSSIVGDSDSEYLSFFGYGTCTIKYPATRLRLKWL